MGEQNGTQIVTLNQPATIRCLAVGPQVHVTWWRGNAIMPYSGDRSEVRKDYSLHFKNIELSDLGPYLCHAYTGKGKPYTVTVTLKAVGPVHIKNKDDERYLKYLLPPAETPRQPGRRPAGRPSQPPRQPQIPKGKCMKGIIVCAFCNFILHF